MSNHISHAALPFPVKGARFTIAVPYLDADGDPTDPTTPDTEISKDAGAFADCTEEVSTISGSNGSGYITLTGDETNCSLAIVCAKVASGPKATLASLHPRVLPVLFSGTAQAGASGSITLASGSPIFSLVGCIVKTTGGTGGAGGSGSQGNQARVITAYDGSTKVASVSPNWETNPDNTTTYEILLTEQWDPSGCAAWLTWEESRANHVSAGSFGLSLQIVRDGTAQDGDTAEITLDAGASATNDIYNNMSGLIYAGLGAGQTFQVSNYVGASKVATIRHNWLVVPDNTSKFILFATRWGGNIDNVLGVVAGEDHGVSVSGVGVLAQNEDEDKIATADSVALLQTILDKLDAMIEASGGHNRFKATALEQAPTGGGGGLDAAGVRAALGMADDDLDDQLDALATAIAAVKVRTDNLPDDPADASVITAAFSTVTTAIAEVKGYVDTEVAAALAILQKLDTALEADGMVYRFTTNALEQAPTGLSTELADKLDAVHSVLTTPMPELTEEPPAEPNISQLLMAGYMRDRNQRTVTKTVDEIRNDAGDVVFYRGITDDGTTFTHGKVTS